jgi:mono/diheme cytochrome c family protein
MARPRILAVVCLLAATAARADPGADGGPVAAAPLRAHAGCGSDHQGLAATCGGMAAAGHLFLARPDRNETLEPEAGAAGRFSLPAWAKPVLAANDLVRGQAGLRGAAAPNEGVGKLAHSGQPIDRAFFGRANTILIADTGDTSRGLAYAQKNCASCHNVLPSRAASPNPDAPPFRTVANTPGMTVTALTVWSRTSHPSMPNLVIEPHEMDDLIAHILGLRDRK